MGADSPCHDDGSRGRRPSKPTDALSVRRWVPSRRSNTTADCKCMKQADKGNSIISNLTDLRTKSSSEVDDVDRRGESRRRWGNFGDNNEAFMRQQHEQSSSWSAECAFPYPIFVFTTFYLLSFGCFELCSGSQSLLCGALELT